MDFTVTRSSGVIVPPSESTPSGTLDLSVIDRLPNLRINIQTLHVFRHGSIEAAKIIREALSKALVPYYPLAGRLKESSQGELQIACTGDGVWFIEADSNSSLESFDYFDNVLMVPYDDLLPTPPPVNYGIDPLVQLQFTRFTCEGFVIGVTFSHSICDGLGAAQFLTAIGEFARGLQHPRIVPVWHRETIPAPARLVHALGEPKPPPPPIPTYPLEHVTIDISLEQINKLKNQFLESTGEYCSTFDVVAASIWRHRTQAIELGKEDNAVLVFMANTRHLLDPPLPDGFYGNCFFPVTVTVSSGWLLEASNTAIVKVIKDAKARLPIEFMKWLKSDELDDGDDPFTTPLQYSTLYISELSRLGFNQIDYGWGPPIHVLPKQGPSIMPVVLVELPPSPKKGIRLMTWCVKKVHLSSLEETLKLY
ncbi:Acyl transferase [Thalictrum thalictroides]|uniref:Acyl transferase n=1 Tax=Thalictrum thalictroides TaxID=46969 RepID=A0A7J6W3J1_THATH|nr:Acyl transferase [Thalictrum thalictroides]